MIKEATGVGSTVEDAREDALKKLGAGVDDDVKFDIVMIPKKKVLGLFGGSDAKVRAYIEGPDTPEEKPARKPQKDAKPKEKKPVKQEAAKETAPAQEPVGIPAEQLPPQSQAGRAYGYLKTLLEKLECSDISATVVEIEGGSKITLTGSDKLGVIIGRRGETLDALQYLASLVANDNGGGYYRIVIDIGNYREKREVTLEALARRTAAQVLRSGRSRSLEPMNPYERRIIHTAVQAIEGVSSSSVGDGPNRRVVITPEGGRPPRPHNGRGRNPRPAAKERSAAPAAPAQKPKETDGTKLYGKLSK